MFIYRKKNLVGLLVQIVVHLECFINGCCSEDVHQDVIRPPVIFHPLAFFFFYSDQIKNSGLTKVTVLNLWSSGFCPTGGLQWLVYSCSGVLQFAVRSARTCMCMMKSGKNVVIFFENSLSTFREVILRDLQPFFCQWSKIESGKDIFFCFNIV